MKCVSLHIEIKTSVKLFAALVATFSTIISGQKSCSGMFLVYLEYTRHTRKNIKIKSALVPFARILGFQGDVTEFDEIRSKRKSFYKNLYILDIQISEKL